MKWCGIRVRLFRSLMAFITLGGASENNFAEKSSCKSSVVVGSLTAEQICAVALDMLSNTMLDNLFPLTCCYTVEEKNPPLPVFSRFITKEQLHCLNGSQSME